MIQMTFDEYDAMMDRFKEMPEKKRLLPFWPTTAHVDQFEKEPQKWLRFCLFFYEMNPEPKTPAEKYSRKNMAAFIFSHLQLV